MHPRRIADIRQLLSVTAAEQLIYAFITSRSDFCNSLLTGLPQSTLRCLQLVQNAAACLLTGFKRSDHITPILCIHFTGSQLITEFSSKLFFSLSRSSWLCPDLSHEHATTPLCQAGSEVNQQHSLCSSDLLSQLWRQSFFNHCPPATGTPVLKI